MAETHEKDRNQKQTKQPKQEGSRPGLNSKSQQNKDSPSSTQMYGNTDENTHDT